MRERNVLGADNGIGVATNLALMEDKTLGTAPLEFLFTVDEETGLTGANNLLPDFVRSRTLIDLGSEERKGLSSSDAPGARTPRHAGRSVRTRPSRVCSRADHRSRPSRRAFGPGNRQGPGKRNKAHDAGPGGPLGTRVPRVSSLSGGNEHNAIPRESGPPY